MVDIGDQREKIAFFCLILPNSDVWFGLSESEARDWRIGWHLSSAVRGDPGFEVSFDATRREPANDDEPEHEVMLKASQAPAAPRWVGYATGPGSFLTRIGPVLP